MFSIWKPTTLTKGLERQPLICVERWDPLGVWKSWRGTWPICHPSSCHMLHRSLTSTGQTSSERLFMWVLDLSYYHITRLPAFVQSFKSCGGLDIRFLTNEWERSKPSPILWYVFRVRFWHLQLYFAKRECNFLYGRLFLVRMAVNIINKLLSSILFIS